MTDQATALSIMASGGFDVMAPATDARHISGVGSGLNPETLLIIKERFENLLANPCNECIHDGSVDPYVLDYCHSSCKEPMVEPIELTNEIGCSDCGDVDCVCDDITLAPLV
jgi:hypothetical protein